MILISMVRKKMPKIGIVLNHKQINKGWAKQIWSSDKNIGNQEPSLGEVVMKQKETASMHGDWRQWAGGQQRVGGVLTLTLRDERVGP